MEALKDKELEPLSDEDIRHILGKDTKILKYSELAKYPSIDDLLPKHTDYCIVLYELEENLSLIHI